MFVKLKKKIKALIKPYFLESIDLISNNLNIFSKRAFFKSEFNEYVNVNISHRLFRNCLRKDEKVRIVFIFQSASFWPSWETFWNAVNEDERFDPIMLVCDDVIKEKQQFLTARSFLEDLGIPFQGVHDVNLSEINPHIVVLQTPYDGGHRPKYLHGNMLTAKGYRVIYITYGIEISDTPKARSDHFNGSVTKFAWRLYSFSPDMILEYKKHSKSGGDMVRSFGHPKFDFYADDTRSRMPEDILNKANGRLIILWKAHFPKLVRGKLITPNILEYIKFAKSLSSHKNLFFIFMPHPKFYEMLAAHTDAEAFSNLLDASYNVIQFLEDDYRPVFANCDAYIIDRSALMVEAAFFNKPILFMENTNYKEKWTPPVEKIISTYYRATTSKEITEFIKNIVLGADPKFEERKAAISDITSYWGESGIKIKNDVLQSLEKEAPVLTDIS